MIITIKAKPSLYKAFPEYKNKDITFLGIRRDDNFGGGYAINVMIGDFIGEFTVEYFNLKIK